MILLICYSLFLILATIWWLSVQVSEPGQSDERITAIVVTRNEELNIVPLLESLKRQTYPHLEVIMVDDGSTDKTVEYAEKLQLENLRILHLEEGERGNAPKKAGIEKAIKEAEGSIIFTTDGDCVLPPKLIAFYAGMFLKKEVKMLAGPVTFIREKGLWNQLQTVEFSSLMGAAAVAFFLKRPIMCSAANLAYRKSVFLETGGYADNGEKASGDDQFLMNKIHALDRDSLLFVKNKACIVETRAAETPRQFFHQRKRWVGKWRSGNNWVSQLTAILIFLVNALTLWFIATGKWHIALFRFLTEFIFLASVLLFFNRRKSLLFIPFTQMIYPFYAVFFGLISLIPTNYTWKGRRLK